MRKILYCNKCKSYTLKSICQNCSNHTINPKPAKFSLIDKWSKYRLISKENDMEN